MVVALQYMAVLVSLWLIQHIAVLVAEKEGASVAKIRCNQSCGDVVIPYPFGMGKSSCYLDEWFEISCINNSTPFLKKAQLEVLTIALPYIYPESMPHGIHINGYEGGTVLVKHPVVMSAGCNGTRAIPNFTGSTFYYSTKNMFTVVGCNYVVEMRNVESHGGLCRTRQCGGKSDSAGKYCTFTSQHCCSNILPNSDIQVLDLSFRETAPGADKCAFAFIAQTSWLENCSPVTFQDSGYHVPVILEWSVSGDLEAFTRQDGENASFCQSYDYNDEVELLWQCYCEVGFEGNPYLPDGCKDINECEQPEKNYCSGICMNTTGGYRCKHSVMKSIIIGISSSFVVLILFTAMWQSWRLVKKNKEITRKRQFFEQNGGLLLQQRLNSGQGNVETIQVFTSEELEAVTDGFNSDRIVGRGGQGTVYKGMLSDGRIVAVKKMKIQNEANIVEQFINEVMILSQINHRNVVKLLGCCLEKDTPMLVYEFVSNGTLSHYLHDQNELAITWQMRLQIAIDVASALSYLHSTASVQIYHRDIKSTNILLDCNYRAKVSDFGTSRSVALDQTHLSTLVKGTFGYFDPEYFTSSQFTDKSDVYSFGVVLLELLTRQKPVCPMRQEHRSLVAYFITALEENRLFDIVDAPILEEKETREEVIAVANLARKCLNSYGRNRPTMKEVLMSLERVRAMSLRPQEHDEEIEYGMDHPYELSDDDEPMLARTQNAVQIVYSL